MRWTIAAVLGLTGAATGHPDHHPWRPEQTLDRADVFERLDDRDLPSPNRYRGASGAPGPDYWQQQVDYDIDVELDAKTHRLIGTERITYHNNSPDSLHWLWVQLDQQALQAQLFAAGTESLSWVRVAQASARASTR